MHMGYANQYIDAIKLEYHTIEDWNERRVNMVIGANRGSILHADGYNNKFNDVLIPSGVSIGQELNVNGHSQFPNGMYVGTMLDINDRFFNGNVGETLANLKSTASSHTTSINSLSRTVNSHNSTISNLSTSLASLSGVNGIRIKGGSIVRTVYEGTSYPLFSDSDMSAILGVSNSNVTNTIVFFENGDGAAQSVHIDGSTHLNNTWYATANRGMAAAPLRINWLAVYFG